MKTAITAIVFIFVFITTSNAQTFKERFQKFHSEKDSLEQLKLLEDWQKSNPKDPELCVAWFNYYVQKSKTSRIVLGNNPKKGEDVLELQSMDSSKQKPAAFLYGDTEYNPRYLKKAYEVIDKGIKDFPSRLDLRFGKVYLLGETNDYENFTSEIIKVIDYDNLIKSKWTWSESEPFEKPEAVLLETIQGYQLQLYNTEDDALLANMERIANAVLKYRPEHVESLSDLAIVFLLKNEYDKALTALLKAEKINPKDAIVLNNIAHAYKLKGDKANAITYYELTIKYGDKEEKKFASQQIELLKK